MNQLRKKNIYIIPWLFCLLFSIGLNAQRISVHHPQLRFLFEDSLLQQPPYHSALLPLEIPFTKFTSVFKPDSALKNIQITPVIYANTGYVQNNKEFIYQLGQGGYLCGNLGKRAGFELSAILYEQKLSGENYSLDSLKLIPHYNRYLWNQNGHTGYTSIRGKVYWKANRWLTFTAGNDKHFIGDGQRSMILSENATAYPFFQTRLNIWKVNYFHQIMFMKDVVPGLKDKRFDKYASMHTISVNATKRINFYIFEAVVWRKQDSVRHRGFDVNYLNPFLFFRPVEFNMGSPDNVLMGAGGKLIIGKHSLFYGQFMLDEFRFSEVKAQNGWWANKYALQAGFKTYSLWRNHKSVFVVEYNHCRPFVYAHKYSLQNYGYLNESLAHPQGSNFREVITTLKLLYKNNWIFNIVGQFINYGTDYPETNYGSDIYKGQYTYTNEYGNSTVQGIKNTRVSGELTISRILKPAWRLVAFSTFNLALHKTEGINDWQPMVQIGVNTLLYE